jgi:hypothetical protein
MQAVAIATKKNLISKFIKINLEINIVHFDQREKCHTSNQIILYTNTLSKSRKQFKTINTK